jgi:hypothetical protein
LKTLIIRKVQGIPGNQSPMQLFWMMYMMKKWLRKGTIIYLMKVPKLYIWTDARRPCISLNKAKTNPTRKKMSPRRAFVNKSKNKNDFKKENEKDKEKMSEKKENEKMMDNVGSKKQHLMSNST